MFGDKYKVKFTYESQAILSEEQSLGIYRIIQEISSNIAKHSQADSIEISIAQKGKTIFLKVIDNGKGFNLNKIQTNRGFGLNNMKIRVEDMGGSLHISSGLGKGTKILIEVPIEP
jgi:signal transduction histidine kinase